MLRILALALAPFGHDHYVARDSCWCWFADPRAIVVGDRLVAGGVTKDGDVVANLYDFKSKQGTTSALAKAFEKDDHANPAFLKLPDGRLAVFYSKHTGPAMWMRTTPSADLSQWTEARSISPNDPSVKSSMDAYCYPNPQMLASEKNRIYLLYRGMNWKPTVAWSDDLGASWTKAKALISVPNGSPNNRPYMKVAGDGASRIHLAFTDGHPRNEPTNSIYYARYEKAALRGPHGEVLANMSQLPLAPEDASVVYDGRSEGVRSWIWDVAATSKGEPVIVYTRLPKVDEHIYRYAWWNGRRWVDRKIVDAGKWFPQTPEGTTEPEPHYSGGICLDPDDPRFVYLSRPINGRFEIERWFTSDGGDHWSKVAITGNSRHDSVRPFVPKGAHRALWVNANQYVRYTDYQSTVQAADELRGPFSSEAPNVVAEAVWRWVRSHKFNHANTDWTMAPLLSGLLDYAATFHKPVATEFVELVARDNQGKLGPRPFMADDQAVGQAYLQLNAAEPDSAKIAGVKAWANALLAQPNNESLEWKNGIHDREWAWCDALFMAPPTLAMLAKQTSDHRYLDLCSKLWWKTSDYLYDPKESLFFRDSRYFDKKEANGAKVFWSRGNGWVLAGLARVLANTAKTDPLRPKWEAQFKVMSARIAELQTKDGTWHASLLDPASYPAKETSGTGFYCYALAWGVRTGLLDRAKFLPIVDKAFASLVACVDPNGRLGNVQPVGQDPKTVTEFDTDSFGVGAFLLAASQVELLRREALR